MSQEDKDLLIKDLSARLPYEIKVKVPNTISINALKIYAIEQMYKSTFYCKRGEWICKFWNDTFSRIDEVKPYLRPMSSMTEEERNEYEYFIIHREHINAQGQEWDIDCFSFDNSPRLIDWLNAHHFDYRNLIKKGLALEAPKYMYKEE